MSGSPASTVFRGVNYPHRLAAAQALASLVPCTLSAARQAITTCNGDCDAALERLRAARAARARTAAIARIGRATGFSTAHLSNIARRDNLSLDALAEWARTNSHQITVGGKTYQNKNDYFRRLNRQYKIPENTLKRWLFFGTPIEELAAKALAQAKKKNPDRYRRPHGGPVDAYGWRWASFSALCKYYSGYDGINNPIKRTMEQSRIPLTPGKAALETVLRLFDNSDLCDDCRWPPEREAKMPKSWLPLNGRDAREFDDDNMAAWHAGIMRSHARDRELAEQLARERELHGIASAQPPPQPPAKPLHAPSAPHPPLSLSKGPGRRLRVAAVLPSRIK